MNATSGRRLRGAAVGVWLLVGALPAGAQPALEGTSSPRLLTIGLPVYPPLVISGGEVVLELVVDAAGAVTEVLPLRATPPFTEALTAAAHGWRFEPSVRLIDEDHVAAPGRVLVAAIFRPPTLYDGATPGTPPLPAGLPSEFVPQPVGLTPPVYPATALGDGMVLVEIELTALAEPIEHRVLAATPGFEDVALDAVRNWRFSPPAESDPPGRLFVYALVGFREPVTPASPR
jgi:hypothetical protein